MLYNIAQNLPIPFELAFTKVGLNDDVSNSCVAKTFLAGGTSATTSVRRSTAASASAPPPPPPPPSGSLSSSSGSGGVLLPLLEEGLLFFFFLLFCLVLFHLSSSFFLNSFLSFYSSPYFFCKLQPRFFLAWSISFFNFSLSLPFLSCSS